jgi:hypothetical protein
VKAKAANTNNPIANRLVFFMLVSFPDLASSLTRPYLVMRRQEEKGVMTFRKTAGPEGPTNQNLADPWSPVARTAYQPLLTFARWLLYRLPNPVSENGIPKVNAS